ncbi:MAG: diguanylate cyclase [Rhodospirillaceae bacterium]|nr:diguanylate cyclase [Rhodospirillaceae bacterium]
MEDTFGGGQHGIYFISYATMATIAFILVALAQYKRKKSENIPINMNILKIIGGIAMAMWTSAALTSATYTTSPTNTAIAAFCVGVIFSIFVAWQLGKVVRKMTEDEKTIRELSTTCSLTTLWNRRVFQETIATEVTRSRRHGHPLSILFLGVEGIGIINGKHGYESGDKVLRDVAAMLINSTRENDRVCRYSGTKIAIILPDTNLADAEMFANRLREKIAAHKFEAANNDIVSATVSIGVADYSKSNSTDASITYAAYDALQSAQEIGPNTVRCYNKIDSPSHDNSKGTYASLPAKLEISIPVIDMGHDKIYSYIQKINEAEKNKDTGAVEMCFAALVKHIKIHFQKEELGLKACGYDNLQAHIGEHRKLEEDILSINWDMLQHPEIFHRERLKDLRPFLLGWFNKHIADFDMSYKDVLNGSPAAIKAMEEYDAAGHKKTTAA